MKRSRAQLAFEKSFLQLMQVKKFEDISVNEIIVNSTYSKASFYNYYDDKYNLAQKLIDQEAQQLEDVYQHISQSNKEGNYIDADTSMITILNHIYKHKDIYHIILNELIPGYSIHRFLRVTNTIYDKYGTWAEVYKGEKVNRDFFAFFLSSCFFSAVLYWDKNNYKQSAKQICNQYNLALELMLDGNALIRK